MDKLKKNSKVIALILAIGLMLLVMGFSYAFFIYNKTGLYTHIITGGKMKVIYDELSGNNILISNAYPLTNEKALTEALEFEFTITGYNESNKNVYYSIEVEHGEDLDGMTRFMDSDIKLSFFENDKIVFENRIFENLNKQIIHYGEVQRRTSSNNQIINKYMMRMWIGDNVIITDTPENIDLDGKNYYSSVEFENCFASFKVNVHADLTYDQIGYIVYDANGGEFTVETTNVLEGRITLQKPVMENKGFLGWSSDKNAIVPEYYPGDPYSGEGVRLYAIYSDVRNVMNSFVSPITNYIGSIKNVYFINDTKENIDTKYNSIGDDYKADLTYNNQGSVKGWLEVNPIDSNRYDLYIASEGPTYLSRGNYLFINWTCENIDFSNVDTSMITDMSSMFAGNMYNSSDNMKKLDLSVFNTSNVTNMSNMFGYRDLSEGLDVSNFDTSKVTDMNGMFQGTKITKINLSSFDTSNVKNIDNLFSGSQNIGTVDLSGMDFSNVTSAYGMFYNCSNLQHLNLSNVNFDKINVISDVLSGLDNLMTLDLSDSRANNITSLSFSALISLTEIDLSNFRASNLRSLSGLFNGLSMLNKVNLKNVEFGTITNMSNMFRNCVSLESLVIDSIDTNNVIDMSYMFYGCTKLIDLELINFSTKNVVNMASMFSECSALTNLDLKSFDTRNVTNMSYMFWRCRCLVSLDISNFTFSTTLLEKENNYSGIFGIVGTNLTTGTYTTVYVNSTTEQSLILTGNFSTHIPDEWSISNVLVKS